MRLRVAATRRMARATSMGRGLAALVVVLAACHGSSKPEAERVLRALEELRNATNVHKAPLVRALADAPCTDAVVCAMRDRCADAYGHLARGVAGERHVRDRIARLEADPPDGTAPVDELNAELKRAEGDLDTAQRSMAACEQATATLRQKYGI